MSDKSPYFKHKSPPTSTSAPTPTTSTRPPPLPAPSTTPLPGFSAASSLPRPSDRPPTPAPAPAKAPSPIASRSTAGAAPTGASASASPARDSRPIQFNNRENPNVNVGPGGAIRRSTNSIQINVCQKGNPVIAHIRNVAWEYADIVCDYQVGATTGVLYLSLRYHQLHPEYIHTRIERVGQSFSLRILLIMCDADNHAPAMRELNKVALTMGYTLLVAWNAAEAGRYLEVFKGFERKGPEMIRAPVDDDYMSMLGNALTSVKGINKTDVATLSSSLGSFAKIVTANAETLASLPGLGDKKVKRLRDACEATFLLKSQPARKKVATAGEMRAERAKSSAERGTVGMVSGGSGGD